MGVGDPIIPVPRRWSASPLFGLVVTSFLFAKEAQKGMSSPSLEGTKPLAEGMEVPVGSELGSPEGPSVFGFCDGLRGKSGVGSLYHAVSGSYPGVVCEDLENCNKCSWEG